MPNHVHIVLVPTGEDGLQRTFADLHRRHTGFINARAGNRAWSSNRAYLLGVDDEVVKVAPVLQRTGRSLAPAKRGRKLQKKGLK